jgi:transcriptional regulator with XRE-family HTH domain
MDTWPKRAAFSAHIKAYQEKTGKTQAEVAADLGMALASLRQLLYQKARQASLETCQKAATLFGCSVTEFIDDPGSKPGGVDLPSDASPIQRWWFEQSIQALGDEELDDDDRRSIFDDLLRDIEKRKQMKRKFGKK